MHKDARAGYETYDAGQVKYFLTHSFLQGSFLLPKLIILIKCSIDVLFFKVLF